MTPSPHDLRARLAAAEGRVRRLERVVPDVKAAAPRRSEDDWHLRSVPPRSTRRRRHASPMVALLALLVLLAFLAAVPTALADDATPSQDPSHTAEPSPSDAPTPLMDTTTPTETDTATPAPTDTGTPTPTETATPTDTATPSDTATPEPTTPASQGGVPTLVLPPPTGTGADIGPGRHPQQQHRRGHRSDGERWKHWRPSTAGAWSTRRLDRAAADARRKGWSTARIADQIYAPFPVMGPASWSDSWGAPRFVGGYHPHSGQDVLCVWGAPVIAIEDATVTYGWNALGGKAAYLSRPDGSFWYYAHLSRTRPGLEGTAVSQGDIIGRCGATGDATVPHVHFAFETADGKMLDTLHALRVTLRLAEAGLYRPSHQPSEQPVPTPDPSTALLTPWPRKPIGPQPGPASLGSEAPEMSLATGVLVAIGVLGPLAFLYRRTRRITVITPG